MVDSKHGSQIFSWQTPSYGNRRRISLGQSKGQQRAGRRMRAPVSAIGNFFAQPVLVFTLGRFNPAANRAFCEMRGLPLVGLSDPMISRSERFFVPDRAGPLFHGSLEIALRSSS
jgi:hypothetical protein